MTEIVTDGALLKLHTTAASMGLFSLILTDEESREGDLERYRRAGPRSDEDIVVVNPWIGCTREVKVDKAYFLRDISREALALSDQSPYGLKCKTLEEAGLLPLGWDFLPVAEVPVRGDLTWGNGGPWKEVGEEALPTVTSESLPFIRRFVCVDYGVLCRWLRNNSSGQYRVAAYAADRIEELTKRPSESVITKTEWEPLQKEWFGDKYAAMQPVDAIRARCSDLSDEPLRLFCELEAVKKEIRDTWAKARDAQGQTEAFRILERMVGRLGFNRTENNPSLV